MKILVDANIVFSGILNSNGKIGDLLVNSSKYYTFIAPDFLRHEIRNKYQRLQKISGMSTEQITEAEYQICKQITFISEEQITEKYWVEALRLVQDVDPKDIHYIAYAKQFKCKLWSGDKKLVQGLQRKGFTNFLTTDELFTLRQRKKK
ncbi:PIN domain-containing protein [Mucilaginibacter sp.]|uniref:PIN domain-containing protein n=1 Tax=Mucilaginibacter sp. TaxID=1882438 RepID=UPI002C5F5885|nr:PIN domain-containing protein [Mucilaginibacter sp.]HTI58610.1 PIN domain-containing protein [Mucilaginibacter sp.]